MLNDFEAVGYGVPALGPGDVVPLNPKATPTPQVAPRLTQEGGRGGFGARVGRPCAPWV